uniref:Uncharacterized protein n=1 Tax=Helianthus annuus TaxID=4232 RepID=A0A251USN4_HELAN
MSLDIKSPSMYWPSICRILTKPKHVSAAQHVSSMKQQQQSKKELIIKKIKLELSLYFLITTI